MSAFDPPTCALLKQFLLHCITLPFLEPVDRYVLHYHLLLNKQKAVICIFLNSIFSDSAESSPPCYCSSQCLYLVDQLRQVYTVL